MTQMKRSILFNILGVFLLPLGFIQTGSPFSQLTESTSANIILVNTFADEFDSPPAGGCSLREAITSASLDIAYGGCPTGMGSDLILLPTGTYTLTRANLFDSEDDNVFGDLDITTPLVPHSAPYSPEIGAFDVEIRTIGNAPATIDANHLDRVFDVFPGAWVNIENLRIINGQSTISGGNGEPGGGIRNTGDLYLENVELYHNYAANATSLNGGDGGAIYNTGILDVSLSFIHFNEAGKGTADGSGGDGGGIFNSGIAGITNSTIEFNWAGDSTASSPGAQSGSGAGIYNNGLLYVTNSTIYYNYAGGGIGDGISAGHGGGIFNSGNAEVLNATIAFNTGGTVSGTGSTPGNGGGIFNSGSMSVHSATIIDNRMFTLDTPAQGTGVYNAPAATLVIGRSILAYNYSYYLSGDEDCAGTITSDDYNLITTVRPATCTITGYTAHDLPPGTDPQVLYPLRDHGGPTETYGLAATSPAVDYIPGGLCPITDQRGFARPVDGNNDGSALCDIGAFERGMALFLPLVRK